VPEVAKQASRLFVFQRSAPWMVPNPRYHAPVTDQKKWLLDTCRSMGRWYRFLLFWPGSDGLMPSLVVDPGMAASRALDQRDERHDAGDVHAVHGRPNRRRRGAAREGDADLSPVREAHAPGQRQLARRAEARERRARHRRDHGDHARGRALEGRSRLRADVIVFATGFHANRFLWPMEIVGPRWPLAARALG